MRNLLAFLLRYQGIMLFVLLEMASLYLLLTNSSYQRAAFFNSANAYAGAVLARRQQVSDYFHLAALNQQLLAENARLRQQVFPPDYLRREADSLPVGRDTLGRLVYRRLRPAPGLPAVIGEPQPGTRHQAPGISGRPDTLLLGGVRLAAHDGQAPLVPARVVDNSLRSVDNYLTLNVGAADGVQPGQGVVGVAGVVGRVRAVSQHYATVASLLHSKTAVAAKLKRDGTFGSVRWAGDDFSRALLDYVPRQNRVQRGDTVVTSGYNAVFPEGLFIGTVETFVKEPDKNFWTIGLRLGTDFSRLTYVYVVPGRPHAERDSLAARLSAPEVPGKPGKPSVAPAGRPAVGPATPAVRPGAAPATRPATSPAGPAAPLALPPGYRPDPSKTSAMNAALAQQAAKGYAAKLVAAKARAAQEAAKAKAANAAQPAGGPAIPAAAPAGPTPRPVP